MIAHANEKELKQLPWCDKHLEIYQHQRYEDNCKKNCKETLLFTKKSQKLKAKYFGKKIQKIKWH